MSRDAVRSARGRLAVLSRTGRGTPEEVAEARQVFLTAKAVAYLHEVAPQLTATQRQELILAIHDSSTVLGNRGKDLT